MDVVIGGSGFIGCHLVRLLTEQGRAVRVFDLAPYPQDETIRPAEVVQGDIGDASAVLAALQGAEVVYHLAANPNLWAKDMAVFDRVNRQGTENVLAAVAKAGVEKLVYTSTESILAPATHHGPITENVLVTEDDQMGPYCRSKFLAERAVFEAAAEGLPAVVVNPTMPMGPGDRNLTPPGRMLQDFLAGKLLATIHCTLNFVDVRDAALGHILAAQHGKPSRRYILAGHNVSVQELLTLAAELTGKTPPKFRVPYPVALGFAYVEEAIGSLTGRRPMSSVTGVKLCKRSLAFDGSRTWAELGGHTPRPLKDSLTDALTWHQARM